jgi:spore germination cell wall hydrolase CwlJ-like protein
MLQEACLALAIYWEARNQPTSGQQAVAEVVINRSNSSKFPKGICAVVTETCDFSFYCDGLSDVPKEKSAWQKALKIAKNALVSTTRILPKTTYYFHNTTVSPPFFKKKTFVTQIGSHKFYKEKARI